MRKPPSFGFRHSSFLAPGRFTLFRVRTLLAQQADSRRAGKKRTDRGVRDRVCRRPGGAADVNPNRQLVVEANRLTATASCRFGFSRRCAAYLVQSLSRTPDRAIDQSDCQHTRRIDHPNASISATMVEKGKRFLKRKTVPDTFFDASHFSPLNL